MNYQNQLRNWCVRVRMRFRWTDTSISQPPPQPLQFLDTHLMFLRRLSLRIGHHHKNHQPYAFHICKTITSIINIMVNIIDNSYKSYIAWTRKFASTEQKAVQFVRKVYKFFFKYLTNFYSFFNLKLINKSMASFKITLF